MSLDQETAALRAVPLFQHVRDKSLQLLAFLAERERFRPGEAMCLTGELGEHAYVLLEGSANVLVGDGDERRQVAVLGPHQVVGEIAVLCDVPRTADVIAADEVLALRISKELLLQMLAETPEMALEVMRSLAIRLHETTQALQAARAVKG
ncbi:MAG: cyclic nucleotide-binding domain-containing protein [Pseudomonadota bacterium]